MPQISWYIIFVSKSIELTFFKIVNYIVFSLKKHNSISVIIN